MQAICDVCKKQAECRMRTDEGGYGPVDVQTCEECHTKEVKSVREESRRTGFRLRIKPWSKLTTKGWYSEVR